MCPVQPVTYVSGRSVKSGVGGGPVLAVTAEKPRLTRAPLRSRSDSGRSGSFVSPRHRRLFGPRRILQRGLFCNSEVVNPPRRFNRDYCFA